MEREIVWDSMIVPGSGRKYPRQWSTPCQDTTEISDAAFPCQMFESHIPMIPDDPRCHGNSLSNDSSVIQGLGLMSLDVGDLFWISHHRNKYLSWKKNSPRVVWWCVSHNGTSICQGLCNNFLFKTISMDIPAHQLRASHSLSGIVWQKLSNRPHCMMRTTVSTAFFKILKCCTDVFKQTKAINYCWIQMEKLSGTPYMLSHISEEQIWFSQSFVQILKIPLTPTMLTYVHRNLWNCSIS